MSVGRLGLRRRSRLAERRYLDGSGWRGCSQGLIDLHAPQVLVRQHGERDVNFLYRMPGSRRSALVAQPGLPTEAELDILSGPGNADAIERARQDLAEDHTRHGYRRQA